MSTIPCEYDTSKCLQTIAEIEADLGRLTANLTECQFQAPPRNGGWSVAYCLEHLILTGNAFLAAWDAALATGRRSGGPFRYSWMARGLLRFAAPPYRIKTKTTPPFSPRGRRSKEETVRRFLKMHQEMSARVAASRDFDAARIKVQSPFLSWIRFPLGLSFDLVLTHERRHLWQAWQVTHRLVDEDCNPTWLNHLV